MPLGFGERRWPIGVDFDGRFVRAAQLAGGPGAWRLAAALHLPRVLPGTTFDAREVEQLAGALGRQGFEGRRIVLAVPEEKMVTGVLELPPRASGAPVDDIARTELANMHSFDPQTAEMACWDLPASSRQKDVTQAMAVACRHADAEALLDVFEEAGLEVQALDSRLHALVRGCQPALPATGKAAVLEWSQERAMLILLYEGTVIYKWVMAEASVGQLAAALGEGLHVEADAVDYLLAEVGLAPRDGEAWADAAALDAVAVLIRKHLDVLADAMQAPLTYSTQLYCGTSLDQVVLVGQGATVPGAGDYLQSRLGVGVRTVAPSDVVVCPETIGPRAADPAMIAALGLSQFFA